MSTGLFLRVTASTEERKGRAQHQPSQGSRAPGQAWPSGALGVWTDTFTLGDVGLNKSSTLPIECPVLWPWLDC